MKCPLCNNESVNAFSEDKRRVYFKCSNCSLAFVERSKLLSQSEERKRYDLHDNTLNNVGYVKYLSTIADIISDLNIKNPVVLDFGCGKNAVLETILTQKKITCISYDPLYNIGLDSLKKQYDIIVMYEVIEHAYDIGKELKLLSNLLKVDGILILRTEILEETNDFNNWWYKEDPTHVNFFAPKTLETVIEIINGEIVSREGNTVIIKKK